MIQSALKDTTANLSNTLLLKLLLLAIEKSHAKLAHIWTRNRRPQVLIAYNALPNTLVKRLELLPHHRRLLKNAQLGSSANKDPLRDTP